MASLNLIVVFNFMEIRSTDSQSFRNIYEKLSIDDSIYTYTLSLCNHIYIYIYIYIHKV